MNKNHYHIFDKEILISFLQSDLQDLVFQPILYRHCQRIEVHQRTDGCIVKRVFVARVIRADGIRAHVTAARLSRTRRITPRVGIAQVDGTEDQGEHREAPLLG